MQSQPLTIFAAGPGDPSLARNAIEGYRPIRGPGEVVQNAFVDSNQYTTIRSMAAPPVTTNDDGTRGAAVTVAEQLPPFHEWATTTEGMVCLQQKKRMVYNNKYVAAQMAVPVISCASKLGHDQITDYMFAGIARSRSIRSPSDGASPMSMTDEMFTLAIGGLVTVLNNSSKPIRVGEDVEWFFLEESAPNTAKRRLSDCRRIGTRAYTEGERTRIYGVAKRSAPAGYSFDVLLKL